jgi:hypothetical protein
MRIPAVPNAAYRFNPPGDDRSPFRTFGKPGYEAGTRELILLARDLDHKEREAGFGSYRLGHNAYG